MAIEQKSEKVNMSVFAAVVTLGHQAAHQALHQAFSWTELW